MAFLKEKNKDPMINDLLFGLLVTVLIFVLKYLLKTRNNLTPNIPEPPPRQHYLLPRLI
jgi:hypothetical protein